MIPQENKVLIIDDDMDLSYLLKEILLQQKLDVVLASNLREAEAILKKDNFSMIFLDHHLPDGLGIPFIPTIRAMDDQAKIIVITADPSGAMRQKAIGEGSTYFLSKPFSITAVNDVIDTIRVTAG